MANSDEEVKSISPIPDFIEDCFGGGIGQGVVIDNSDDESQMRRYY
jgi:hypothetical protein